MQRLAFIWKCQGADAGMGSCNYRGTDGGAERAPRSKTETVTSQAGCWEISAHHLFTHTVPWLNTSIPVFRPFLSQMNSRHFLFHNLSKLLLRHSSAHGSIFSYTPSPLYFLVPNSAVSTLRLCFHHYFLSTERKVHTKSDPSWIKRWRWKKRK